MKNKVQIEKILKGKYPIWGYSPKGLKNLALSIELSKLNGIGLVDLEGISTSDSKTIIHECLTKLEKSKLWGIRVKQVEQLLLLEEYDFIPIIIIAFDIEEKVLSSLTVECDLLIAEVNYFEQAQNRADWADLFLVKGFEGGGEVGEKSSFILLQQFNESGYPFIIQGGFGVYNIISAFVGGALGVVLEGQLFLLPECPLDKDIKDYISSLDENDTYIIGESSDFKYRLVGKIANQSIRKAKKITQVIDDPLDTGSILKEIEKIKGISSFYNDKNIKQAFLPSGIGITFAKYISEKYSNLRDFLIGISNLMTQQIEAILGNWPFGKDNNFAKDFGIDFPIIQGPMANISDNTEFAKQVAEKGALPILALGGLMKEEAEELFVEIKKTVAPSYSYGGGIIGLNLMKDRREEHIALLKKYETPICLVAAGTVNLASRIKKLGFKTLLHTPALSLFKDAIKNNINNLILEGSECGGHIGTQTSLTLWERILQYTDSIRADIREKVNVIFAGGIGDELGSSMIAAMIGTHLDVITPALQIGTAYLFTEEIVRTKALSLIYQEKILNSFKTKVIGTTVNTRARVLPTAFVDTTNEKEFERLRDKQPISKRKKEFEKDNLGALRIATKGEKWNHDHVPGGETTQFIPVTKKEHEALGCFMTGEIASIKRNVIRIDDLHFDVVEAGKNYLSKTIIDLRKLIESLEIGDSSIETADQTIIEGRVAIIGLGCIFPDSPNIETYWQNIVNKKYSITEIPHERWEPELYYDADPKAEDKTYSKIGSFIKDYKFNSIEYRIPPTIANKMDAVQQWSLDAAGQALRDAGIPTDGKNRLPIAVIVGNAIGGEIQRSTNRRIFVPEIIQEIKQNEIFDQLSKEDQDAFIEKLRTSYKSKFPTITEDSMPGELSNVIAGRIANIYNLTGKSMTTDAACASSVASLDTAVNALKTHDFDVVLVGGADRSMDVTSYVKFSKIGALSAEGSRPFDEKADGFVMGEGCGFLVLKRLEDAIRDGNKIYSIISAIGSSSDGKGKGITAPNPDGQKQSVLRALDKAKLDTTDIQLIEAHGTSTTVGDAVELQVLEEIFKDEGRKEKLAIGSIKSQIGHLKSAAGVAALIKTSLAIHNKILPPSINVEKLNPRINWEESPFYVNTEPLEWKVDSQEIRRAGVSSFGFGGTNYHAILEEYDPQKTDYIHEAKISSVQTAAVPKSIATLEDSEENPICFMFTGQGSQYLGMLQNLCETSKIVADTFEEAENIWFEYCTFSLKEIIFGSEDLTQEASSQRLTDTKFTQPALFVVDIAIYRYLREHGISPSIVAGHSLGEYAALVAAGVLSFSDGLKAVIERGRSMSKAGKEAEGAMAAVLAPIKQVEELVDSVKKEYVTIANYNSINQTVVSGSLSGIETLIEEASKQGITAKKLRVSTAFHSGIVKQVEEEMKKVLLGLTFNPPKIDVYSNVTGMEYPSQPELIQNLLIEQICSSVKWVEEIENIYKDGGRIFVEVGPKKALFSFAKDILKQEKDIQVLYTLTPKEKEDEKLSQTIDQIKELIVQRKMQPKKVEEQIIPRKEIIKPAADMDFNQYILRNRDQLHDFLRKGYELYSTYTGVDKKSLSYSSVELVSSSIGVTGVGMGIPGKNRNVFDDENISLLLSGVNLIDEIDDELKKEILDKNIVRLVKSADGNASFENIDDLSKVIQIAGQIGKFDPINDYGINPKFLNALDITFQLAICAGLEALKDAGIPLVRSKIKTSTGKILEGEWALPANLQETTGIVFASAFPGYDQLIKEVTEGLTTKEERQFSREFLFRILSMGHSQFAQMIKAKGPNTQINAACASTTQAIGIAEDWIKTGRCERVIVVAADDASSENLLPWIGAGFLAAGGVSTKKNVEEAAIPFGKDRHGLVIGSAAAGLVLEKEEAYQERGVKPIVDIIGTQFANSAFHGSRLDVNHIAKLFDTFVKNIEKQHGISRDSIATEGMFVSHETYTPARGGSAEAEIESLRKVFGSNASKMIIMNTKGYTGHPMGAGIEEVLAIKSMEKGIVPPIANIKEIDPKFTDLNFSRGFNQRMQYAIRLAAGFGSQIAFVAFRLNTFENRFDNISYEKWLNSISGTREGIFTEGRVLKLEQSSLEEIKQIQATKELVPSEPASDILSVVIREIAEKTGYEPSLIEADMNLEEDLGIDTVKQAEIFGTVREKWNLELDETVSLADFTTPEKIAAYIQQNTQIISKVEEVEVKEEKPSGLGLNEVVKNVVSRTTGYEPELIDNEMDLEEDLGIDTIKQAEIFGEIRDEFSLPLDESVSLAEFRTINDIVEYISKNTVKEKTETVKQEIEKPKVIEDKIEEDILRIERLVPTLVPLDKDNVEKIDLTTHSNAIINFDSFFTRFLMKDFVRKGIDFDKIDIEEISFDKTGKKEYDNFILVLPDLNNDPGYVDQSYYERLFKLFQSLNLNSSQRIFVISTEKFFGFERDSYPLSGGVSGFIKTLGHEFEIKVKHVYSDKINEVLEELEYWDENIEISFKNSLRYTLSLSSVYDMIPSVSEIKLDKDDILLVTGGGRGITFKCLEAVCSISKPKVAILGIEDVSKVSKEDLNLSEDDLKEKKQKLIEKLKESEEKVTPVLIDRHWNQYQFGVEVLQNLQILEKMSIQADYYRVDVTKKNDVKQAIKKIEKKFDSEITHIVHGAGLEESKQFKKKKFDFSKLIVSVKVEGIWNILNAVNQKKLKRLVCFTSIAGRFGNPGQVDYSYANGYLSRLCWMLDQQGISSIACDWSAWGQIGMATRGSILEILKAQGLEPIPLNRGIETFVKLFVNKENNEVVVSCGLGPFDKLIPSQTKLTDSKYPMMHGMEYHEPIYRGDYAINSNIDLYLKDHQIQGIPIFPGVMGLEMFAEMYSLVNGKNPDTFENIEFKTAIKQRGVQSKEVYVEYDVKQERMKLKSDFFPKIKEKRKVETEHFTTEIRASSKKLRRKRSKISINEKKIELLSKEDIYSVFFHGKSFQVLEELVELTGEKAIAKVYIPEEKLFSIPNYEESLNPLTIEAALQTAGLYDYLINKKTSLPSKIKQLRIISKVSPKYVVSKFKSKDETHSYYDVEVLDENKYVIIQLKELALIHTQLAYQKESPNSEKEDQLREYWEISSNLIEKKMKVVPIKTVSNYLSNEPEVVLKYLSPTEKTSFDKIKNKKRKIEYLSGVIATKDLYSEIKENPDVLLEIEVRKMSKGQPYIFDKKEGKRSDLHLSISHAGDFAISTLSEKLVGIDIERIEHRNEGFYKEAFTEKEREIISNDENLGTVYWTIKEAITKALGEGLHLSLHDVEIFKEKKSENYRVNFSKTIKETIPYESSSFKLENKTSTNYSISYCEIENRSKKNVSRKS